jgi:CRISPR-associated endonuclease Cas1 subtype I-B
MGGDSPGGDLNSSGTHDDEDVEDVLTDQLSTDEVYQRGETWYRSLFRHAGTDQLCGESSTCYSRWPHFGDVAGRIARDLPNVKLIYIMRHPVDRAYSHYAHNMQWGVTMSFEEALEAFEDSIDRLETLKGDVDTCDDVEILRGIEATARKTYYNCFDEILREPFRLPRREYNPPSNETNALISFLNAMVYTTCVSAIRKTALDPTIGYMHEPGDRRFTLSLDIADIFKPILADRVLFRVVNRQEVGMDDFEQELDGCLLTEDGRLAVLEAYEETLDRTVEHPRLNRKVSYKTLVQTDVYSLKKHVLTGEPYRPTERWW